MIGISIGFRRAALLLFAAGFFSFGVRAGDPAGPYLAFYSTDERLLKETIYPKVLDYSRSMASEWEMCDRRAFGFIYYIERPPKEINIGLLLGLVGGENRRDVMWVTKVLRDFRDKGIDEGLDGAVFHVNSKSDKGARHDFYSIDAKGKLRKSRAPFNPENSKDVVRAFCAVLPPVYRR